MTLRVNAKLIKMPVVVALDFFIFESLDLRRATSKLVLRRTILITW